MKAKKCTHVITCFFISILLFSCINKDSKPKIGFLLADNGLDRYVKESEYFKSKVSELGGDPIVLSAGNNDVVQIQQAKQLLDQGVKVLVVNAANLNTAAAIVRDAHNENVKVVAYDRLISNCNLDYLVTFDNEKIGTMMVDYITKLKPEGNYVLLGGDRSDKNAVWVKHGQKKQLDPFVNSGKIKLVYDIYVEEWSADNAHIEMKKFFDLSGSFPDAIISSNDGMTSGVVDLLKDYGMEGKVLISGQDAELKACRNIINGYQTMTIYKSGRKLANIVAELAMKIAKNEKITEANQKIDNGSTSVSAILLDPVVVDKNTLKNTVIADGYLSEEEIYKN